MTVVVAYRFPEGVVALADSRASWVGRRAVYQDTLQKILPLGGKQALAYVHADCTRMQKAWMRGE